MAFHLNHNFHLLQRINNPNVTLIVSSRYLPSSSLDLHPLTQRLATDYEFNVQRNQIAEIIHVMIFPPFFTSFFMQPRFLTCHLAIFRCADDSEISECLRQRHKR